MSMTPADRLAKLGGKLLRLQQSLTKLRPINGPLILYDDLLADPSIRLDALLRGAAPAGEADVLAVLRPPAPVTDRTAAVERAGPWHRPVAARQHAAPGGRGWTHTRMHGGGAPPSLQRRVAVSSGRPDQDGRSSGAAHRTVPRPEPLQQVAADGQAPAAPVRDADDAQPSPLQPSAPPIRVPSAQTLVVAPAAATVGETTSTPRLPGPSSVAPAAPSGGSTERKRAAGATRLSRGGASLLGILRAHGTPAAEATAAAAETPARAPVWTAAGSWTESVAEALMPAGAHDPMDSGRLSRGVELPPLQRVPATPTARVPAAGLFTTSRATVAAEPPAVAAEQLMEHLADRLELALLRTYGTSGS